MTMCEIRQMDASYRNISPPSIMGSIIKRSAIEHPFFTRRCYKIIGDNQQ